VGTFRSILPGADDDHVGCCAVYRTGIVLDKFSFFVLSCLRSLSEQHAHIYRTQPLFLLKWQALIFRMACRDFMCRPILFLFIWRGWGFLVLQELSDGGKLSDFGTDGLVEMEWVDGAELGYRFACVLFFIRIFYFMICRFLLAFRCSILVFFLLYHLRFYSPPLHFNLKFINNC